MRVNWDKVPYYMITIKPVFGNLGKVLWHGMNAESHKIYRLNSLVHRNLIFEFYDHELILAKED